MKSLKQTQEEELKLVDKTLSREEISKLLVEYSMPTRQVFISELINRINRCLLSAMEASAKGAIMEALQVIGNQKCRCPHERNKIIDELKEKVRLLLSNKAKDYMGGDL